MATTTERLKAASERLEGASWEHPGFVSITQGGLDFAFGAANGPIGYDLAPADDPGDRSGGLAGDEGIPADSSVEEIEDYIRSSVRKEVELFERRQRAGIRRP